ncbi:hypothetical protein OUZ56_025921 [Daphnia magna]|uniref:Uncharacterized protein n=1 Tax=Daphnia magna TaxID=35525 RepID=A0ABQ9ZLR2_9CRUS|nr:hypothetical protein OUZ56_025921 [Daphnia magna]
MIAEQSRTSRQLYRTCREQQMSKISHLSLCFVAMASPAVGFMYENFMRRIKLPKYVLSFDSTNLVR